jgi:hypothetical protein
MNGHIDALGMCLSPKEICALQSRTTAVLRSALGFDDN